MSRQMADGRETGRRGRQADMQCKQPYRQYRQALTKQADRQQTAIKSGQRHRDRQTRTRATDRQTEIHVDGTKAT